LISGAFVLAFRTAVVRSKHVFVSLIVVIVGASASAASSEMRPQVFSFLLFAVTIIILQRFRERGGRVLWLLPPLILIWANLHVVFMAGLALIAIESVVAALTPPQWAYDRQLPRLKASLQLGGIAVVSALAALVTPNGVELYLYPFRLLLDPNTARLLNEYMPPSFNELTGMSFLALLILAVIGLAFSRRRTTLRDFVYVVFFAAAAFKSQRHQVLFAIAAAGPIALWLSYAQESVEGWISQTRLLSPARIGAWSILSLFAATLFCWRISDAVGRNPFDYMNMSEMFPHAACDFIEASDLSGHMYNQYNYGGYLMWRLWPKHRVFVDSRQEPFLRGTFEAEQIATNCLKPGDWESTFKNYDINFAILHPTTMLAAALQDRADWVCVYADDQAMIFVRDIPANAEVIRSAGGG
jgi:hypothetical protein